MGANLLKKPWQSSAQLSVIINMDRDSDIPRIDVEIGSGLGIMDWDTDDRIGIRDIVSSIASMGTSSKPKFISQLLN